MRQLVTIQRIQKVEPHNNADTLDIVKILGWTCIIKKGQFSEGDLACYFEVDSVTPQTPEFDFLKDRKYRIKTIKLRGTISQGLVMPLSILQNKKFPDDTRENPVYDFKEGMEVTAMLGVVKYEPAIPAQLSGIMKGAYPGYIQKTDETRVQILQPLLDKYKGTNCYITEKVDGGSTTFYIYDNEFGVCSRNLELKESPENSMWKFAREKDIEAKMRKFGKDIAIQGEIVGEGINKNTLKLKGQKILFYSVFDIGTHKYYDFEDARKIINDFGLSFVPIISTDYVLGNDIDELVKLSVGKSVINPEGWREGIVIRPLKEIYDTEVMSDVGGRISFKVVNPEYLLKYEE